MNTSVSLTFKGHTVQIKEPTAVKDHILMCNHVASLYDFKVLTFSNSKFHLKIEKIILILRDQPVSNKNEASLPLYLSD